MHCPFCFSDETQVKDSRPADEGQSIRRRRQCARCGARFTTFERVQLRELAVLKSSGKKVPFDREKLHRSVAIAMRKREADADVIDRIVAEIVRDLEALGETDIPSRTIGEHVMAALKRIDEVAYVRYASVYRDFREAKDFREFLGSLDAKDNHP